jgi:hypothetical protein
LTVDRKCLKKDYSTPLIQLGTGLRHICPPISQIVLKNFKKKSSLIIKECPEEIFIKLTIVLKSSM